ncbi:hypothetical protein IPJ72_07365 [Candidatus Peregrinibacteria bacterium]|nr:MAG: hypothetical protein IPJ72_07365 [Candidatus Peregrinibacteria bacterium]
MQLKSSITGVAECSVLDPKAVLAAIKPLLAAKGINLADRVRDPVPSCPQLRMRVEGTRRNITFVLEEMPTALNEPPQIRLTLTSQGAEPKIHDLPLKPSKDIRTRLTAILKHLPPEVITGDHPWNEAADATWLFPEDIKALVLKTIQPVLPSEFDPNQPIEWKITEIESADSIATLSIIIAIEGTEHAATMEVIKNPQGLLTITTQSNGVSYTTQYPAQALVSDPVRSQKIIKAANLGELFDRIKNNEKLKRLTIAMGITPQANLVKALIKAKALPLEYSAVSWKRQSDTEFLITFQTPKGERLIVVAKNESGITATFDGQVVTVHFDELNTPLTEGANQSTRPENPKECNTFDDLTAKLVDLHGISIQDLEAVLKNTVLVKEVKNGTTTTRTAFELLNQPDAQFNLNYQGTADELKGRETRQIGIVITQAVKPTVTLETRSSKNTHNGTRMVSITTRTQVAAIKSALS